MFRRRTTRRGRRLRRTVKGRRRTFRGARITRALGFRKSLRRRKISTMRSRIYYNADRTRVRLHWNSEQVVNIASASSGINVIVFSMNSLRVPETSTGFTDPYSGHDLMFMQYFQCLVKGSKIKVVLSNANSNTDFSIDTCLVPVTGTATVPNSFGQAVDSPYATTRMATGTRASQSLITHQQYMSIRKIMGEQSIYHDSHYQTASTDPTVEPQWAFCYQAPQNINPGATIEFVLRVEMTAYCEFFDRRSAAVTLLDELIGEAKLSGTYDKIVSKEYLPIEKVDGRLKVKKDLEEEKEPEEFKSDLS